MIFPAIRRRSHPVRGRRGLGSPDDARRGLTLPQAVVPGRRAGQDPGWCAGPRASAAGAA